MEATGWGTAKTAGDHKILGVIQVSGGGPRNIFSSPNFLFSIVNIGIWVVYPWPANILGHGQF